MRVVFDTNVIVAAFGTRGLCADLLAACLDQHEIVVSEVILSEVAEHLADKFKLPDARVSEILLLLRDLASIIEPVTLPPNSCRDAEDLPILGTAVAANAACLVTGDNDLLVLNQFQNIPILNPRALYDSIA